MPRIFDGKVYRDMTSDEIAARETEHKKIEAREKHRQLTVEEVNTVILKQQINTIDVEDNVAVRMIDFYPTFSEVIGQSVSQGFKFTYNNKLYRVIQASLLIQEHYIPGIGTESLYEIINEEYDGDIYDPIPYDGNMALESDKYYVQDYVIYLCTRDTVNPVYNPLAELVGVYVELT